MTWRRYLLLALLGLAVLIFTAAFQSAPGYMDADYYYAGGIQLAQGHGFTEPYLWNYLDDPAGMPHPSHAYWMPLASLVSAAGSVLFGAHSWTAGRVGFLLAGAAVPPLTAALAWSLTWRKELAFMAGLLGVFSGFYLPFLPVTDTFGLYMVLGGVFFLLILSLGSQKSRWPIIPILLGLTAGLMHLTRTDGLLWLGMALAGVLIAGKVERGQGRILLAIAGVLGGYLLIMTPWLARNMAVFGSPLGPGSTKMLWLTDYDQLFIYPAERLSPAAWLNGGLEAIARVRAWALGINLERTLAEQGEIFLLPLICLGLWKMRRERAVQLAGAAWLLTLGVMTFLFPFAGARGGFFHSGAALQPMWWALAPIGLEGVIEWGRRKRGWDARQAGAVFRPALAVLAALLTAAILWGRLSNSTQAEDEATLPAAPTALVAGKAGEKWSRENYSYSQAAQFLFENGAAVGDVVMAANPPGFYLASGLSTIAVPDADVPTLLELAERYEARYLILEETSMPAVLAWLYEETDLPADLVLLGEMNHTRIFLIRHP
jgi:hypothetical protein